MTTVEELEKRLAALNSKNTEVKKKQDLIAKKQGLRREIFKAKYGRYYKPAGKTAAKVGKGIGNILTTVAKHAAAVEGQRQKQIKQQKSHQSNGSKSKSKVIYVQTPLQPKIIMIPKPKKKKKQASNSYVSPLEPTMESIF